MKNLNDERRRGTDYGRNVTVIDSDGGGTRRAGLSVPHGWLEPGVYNLSNF
jgi:hypothetical protein